jgi:cyclase
MLSLRVIPVLLLRNKGLVKTIGFSEYKYIGDPINAVKIFNDKEVDELVFLDIDASKTGAEPKYELISEIASECFMPLGYGGGIKNLDEVAKLFDIGVEKIIINSAALTNLDIISRASEIYGSQSIVVGIDTKTSFLGKTYVFSHANVKHKYSGVLDYAKSVEAAGAGEIILTSADRDGRMKGYDLSTIAEITKSVSIPVVVCGGAGNYEDFRKATENGASAVAAGSLFLYHGPHKAVLLNYPSRNQLNDIIKYG